MKLVSIEIVSAQPGFNEVIESDKRLHLASPVIAWRIETYSRDDIDENYSSSYPITAGGSSGSSCIGVQNPDGSVDLFDDGLYGDICDASNSR